MRSSNCLKVQVDDQQPFIIEFHDNENSTNLSTGVHSFGFGSGFPIDVGIVASLLRPFFQGRTQWQFNLAMTNFRDLNGNYAESLNPYVFFGTNADALNDPTGSKPIDAVGFSFESLKAAVLATFYEIGLENDVDDDAILLATPENLQAAIEAGGIGFLRFNNTPISLKFMPCSQEEINNIFDNIGEQQTPHEDAYPILKRMIANEADYLEQEGWVKCEAVDDLITFNANCYLELVVGFISAE